MPQSWFSFLVFLSLIYLLCSRCPVLEQSGQVAQTRWWEPSSPRPHPLLPGPFPVWKVNLSHFFLLILNKIVFPALSCLTSPRAVHVLSIFLGRELRIQSLLLLPPFLQARHRPNPLCSPPGWKQVRKYCGVSGLWPQSPHTSREPSPKIAVRIGVDNMVRMVSRTATPSVMIDSS